jgi:hypothetical protein
MDEKPFWEKKINEIRNILLSGKTKLSITTLLDFLSIGGTDDLTLQTRCQLIQLNNITSEFRLGLTNNVRHTEVINKISFNLLAILNDLETEYKNKNSSGKTLQLEIKINKSYGKDIRKTEEEIIEILSKRFNVDQTEIEIIFYHMGSTRVVIRLNIDRSKLEKELLNNTIKEIKGIEDVEDVKVIGREIIYFSELIDEDLDELAKILNQVSSDLQKIFEEFLSYRRLNWQSSSKDQLLKNI